MRKTNWNLWFYVTFFISLAIGALLLPHIEKGQDVIFINSMHSPFLDNLFFYGTGLGNGALYIIVAAGLLLMNTRNAIIAFICFSITGLMVQFLKKVVFDEMMRPAAILTSEPLHFVEGVKILKHYSFPSGHTATAFSMFCLLSQIIRPRWIGLLFIVMALIGGISRIYLVQHFFIDVYFGAMLGAAVTTLVWWWFSAKSILPDLDGKPLSSILRGA